MTISRSEQSLFCQEGSHTHCEGYLCKCDCHSEPVRSTYNFSIAELLALYRLLEKEYVPYDDFEAKEVVRRISLIIREHEQKLDR